MSAVAMAKEKRNDVSVKMRAEVYQKLRTVASWDNMNIADFLSDLVDGLLDRHIDRVTKEMKARKKSGAE